MSDASDRAATGASCDLRARIVSTGCRGEMKAAWCIAIAGPGPACYGAGCWVLSARWCWDAYYSGHESKGSTVGSRLPILKDLAERQGGRGQPRPMTAGSRQAGRPGRRVCVHGSNVSRKQSWSLGVRDRCACLARPEAGKRRVRTEGDGARMMAMI